MGTSGLGVFYNTAFRGGVYPSKLGNRPSNRNPPTLFPYIWELDFILMLLGVKRMTFLLDRRRDTISQISNVLIMIFPAQSQFPPRVAPISPHFKMALA